MKIHALNITVLCFAAFTFACKEKQELNPLTSKEAPEVPALESKLRTKSSSVRPTADAQFGKLDATGLPTDPSLGMNSEKLTQEQRLELRRAVPEGYHIGQPIIPRLVTGQAEDVEWRKVGDGNFNSVSKELLGKLLGLNPAQLPSSVQGANRVLISPSGGRVLVHLGSTDLLFGAKNGVIDATSEKKIPCVNFDDKRRAFILWDAFASESLMVGHLADDEELEDLPSRHVLYTYDIDKMTLRRVTFPQELQAESGDFVIDRVAPSAVLVRWDRMNKPMTIYLDEKEGN